MKLLLFILLFTSGEAVYRSALTRSAYSGRGVFASVRFPSLIIPSSPLMTFIPRFSASVDYTPRFLARFGYKATQISKVRVYTATASSPVLFTSVQDIPADIRPYFLFIDTYAFGSDYSRGVCSDDDLPVCSNGITFKNLCYVGLRGFSDAILGACEETTTELAQPETPQRASFRNSAAKTSYQTVLRPKVTSLQSSAPQTEVQETMASVTEQPEYSSESYVTQDYVKKMRSAYQNQDLFVPPRDVQHQNKPLTEYVSSDSAGTSSAFASYPVSTQSVSYKSLPSQEVVSISSSYEVISQPSQVVYTVVERQPKVVQNVILVGSSRYPKSRKIGSSLK